MFVRGAEAECVELGRGRARDGKRRKPKPSGRKNRRPRRMSGHASWEGTKEEGEEEEEEGWRKRGAGGRKRAAAAAPGRAVAAEQTGRAAGSY